MRYVGISLGHGTDRDAEHWLSTLRLPDGVAVCTHLTRTPYPHVAVSFAVPDGADVALPPAPSELDVAAGAAARAHAARRSGRAVLFPGAATLTGTVAVADLLARTAIDRVVVLGGRDAAPEELLDTRDFVRPQWMDGTLTLVVMPAAGGRLVPFEVPDPTPCCADH